MHWHRKYRAWRGISWTKKRRDGKKFHEADCKKNERHDKNEVDVQKEDSSNKILNEATRDNSIKVKEWKKLSALEQRSVKVDIVEK